MRGQVQSRADHHLADGISEVRRIASTLEPSESVRDQACQLFQRTQYDDLIGGRSIEPMAVASVYGACRCNGRPRTLSGVTEPARVEHLRIANASTTLHTELGPPAQPVPPSAFGPRLASECNASDRIRQRARKLAEASESIGATTGGSAVRICRGLARETEAMMIINALTPALAVGQDHDCCFEHLFPDLHDEMELPDLDEIVSAPKDSPALDS